MHELFQDLTTGSLVVFALGWILASTRKQARVETRLKAHEDGCSQAWENARDSFKEIKDMIVAQDARSAEYRVSNAAALTAISDKFHAVDAAVKVLEENKRMRERLEDRE